MKKLVKLMAIMLVALIAMPGIATAKTHKGTQKNHSQTIRRHAAAQQAQEVCKISGNDCKKVVILLYEIFMIRDSEKGYVYDRVELEDGETDYKLRVLEPYATQLKKMKITVENMSRYSDGGTTYLTLGDGTSVYFDNNMSKATLTDPRVTLSDGRKFYFSRSEIREKIEKNLRISGNDCQKVVNLLYEIFVEKEAYNHQDNVGDKSWMENKNCQVSKPYASKLKNMNITIDGVYIYTARGGSLVTYVHLADDTRVYFVKNSTTGQYDNPKVDVEGCYSITLPLPEKK